MFNMVVLAMGPLQWQYRRICNGGFHLRKYGRPIEDHSVISSQSDTEENNREGGKGQRELSGGESLLQRLMGRDLFKLGAQSDLVNLKLYSLIS